jgi:ubiquinol-cytochrome c reductase cytochrome c1 subunit
MNLLRGTFLLLALVSVPAFAAEGGLMHYDADLGDRASLQRGARLFVNYCLSCHSASYMRFNRLGRDLGIPEDVLLENLMFGTDKPGDTMTVAMQSADAERWFGVAAPDLSVTARARGDDWLYTYFMTFYRDPKRPTGVNNLAFRDVAMPHVLWELQGWQRAVPAEKPQDGAAAGIERLELETPGKLEPKEYERAVRDLVNFLVYLGEPVKLQRATIGGWVLLYLFVLLVVVYLLKREYWRDVH